MRNNLFKILIFSLLIGSLALTVQATPGGGDVLSNVLTKIKEKLASVGYIVCAIFMIWGGYQMVTSAGDPKKFEIGKTALLYAAIGLIVILVADKLANFIATEINSALR
jgi:uncharacterized protein with GYD domain